MLRIVDNGQMGGFRGYNNPGDRRRGVAALAKQGYNFFLGYRDTKSEYALNYSVAKCIQIYKKDV